MARTDDELENQAQAAQEATPGGRTGEVATRTGGEGGIGGGYRKLQSRYDMLPNKARVGVNLAIIGVASIIPFLLPYITADAQYWTNILTKVGVAALLALGLNVVVGFAGLLDLGYVAFFAVGAYSYAIFSGAARYSVLIESQQPGAAALAAKIKPEWHMYMWLYLFAALAVALVAGVVLGAPTLRLRGDYLAIVTLGFGEIVRITANNLNSITGGPRGILNIPHPAINAGSFNYDFKLQNDPYYWLLLSVIVIWVVFLRRLNASRIGRSWAAIREDELAAAAMGIPTVRMKLLAFAIGAAVASAGGMIYASQISFISPDQFSLFNLAFGSVTILAMVVLGGMGGIAGPILGAALIIFLPERFRFVGDARLLLFGAALVIMMIVRPQGLIPSRRRAAELAGGVKDTTVFEAMEHGA